MRLRGSRGLALRDRRGERPLVDFGRGEELVHGSRERERGAGHVDNRALGRFGPAQFPAREAHAAFPVAQQGSVALAGLEHGAGAVEEPVVAGQAARIGVGGCDVRGQSDASGA